MHVWNKKCSRVEVTSQAYIGYRIQTEAAPGPAALLVTCAAVISKGALQCSLSFWQALRSIWANWWQQLCHTVTSSHSMLMSCCSAACAAAGSVTLKQCRHEAARVNTQQLATAHTSTRLVTVCGANTAAVSLCCLPLVHRNTAVTGSAPPPPPPPPPPAAAAAAAAARSRSLR